MWFIRWRKLRQTLGAKNKLTQMPGTYFHTKLVPRKSLIIFDEIQMVPRAREAVKYLVADGRFDYIETGSLITIKENVRDIVPPSEERKLKMYPLDFEEFAWAFGVEMLIDYIRCCFEKKEPLERRLHKPATITNTPGTADILPWPSGFYRINFKQKTKK